MIEFWAAGDAARERWKERRERTARMSTRVHPALERLLAREWDTALAVFHGGVNRIVISHVLEGDDRPLTAMGPDLIRFLKMILATHEDH
jgi:broad specificity phosphatase PhoE